MSNELSEEEMRLALFGTSSPNAEPVPIPAPPPEPTFVPAPSAAPRRRPVAKALSPKLRVTLHATREFEGEIEVLTYDANTLSTFVAEQEAKNEAKKKKFRYFDVVSVKPI
ncbi:hypothetical protein CCU68_31635 [Pseudomonas gingeri NCPPB 3146 = LMG 5327]|uniref:Uncharacterized protein n=2 Tax=Pseudomonas gingeri TaxID=117681 RepID=A0A7Y7XXB8_9PSED|nr:MULTISPECIES: hypothetical protein [Pseudomonas]NWC13088.1 hypothetical protein [Pseudomonas gingeri]NWE49832.1 hypothetical protein [Pseudomonas gingeri]NWE72363.1 hypothetical protein [Pseudomonas gingeri]PNQ88414.1 hypothetical protein CCU68_31635 [Pseudomonas gingeri NCPPB 3146 = LMG 5327]BBP77543.1 hypothetical protein PHLH7_36470 [Pseudomonas sp. Ost2]